MHEEASTLDIDDSDADGDGVFIWGVFSGRLQVEDGIGTVDEHI